jgi:hypothetical protein
MNILVPNESDRIRIGFGSDLHTSSANISDFD